jgi:excisionase family DNA binding protein
MKDQPDEMIVTLKRSDLRALIREEVAAAVQQALEPQRQKWIDVAAAADHAGVCTKTIRRWIAQGLVANHLGRDYRMRLQDLDAWLEKHRAAPLKKSA